MFSSHHHAKGTTEQLKQALQDGGHWDDYAASFCDEACLNRYLRARSHDVTKAAAMLRATLEWRKKEGIESLQRSEFEDTPFMREGWVYVDGNDADGRSIVMFRKRKDKFPVELEHKYLRYMAFVIESAVKNMRNGQEQWIWVLDLAVYSPSNAPHPSVTLGVLQMLANHYPERLFKAYICNAPSIFQVAYKFLSPFVDPVSKSKVEFVHTDAYEPGKAGKASHHWWSSSSSASAGASSWGSWFGSGSKTAAAKGGAESDTDAAVVISEDKTPKGPGTFGPFLKHYQTPFCNERHHQLLASVGCA